MAQLGGSSATAAAARDSGSGSRRGSDRDSARTVTTTTAAVGGHPDNAATFRALLLRATRPTHAPSAPSGRSAAAAPFGLHAHTARHSAAPPLLRAIRPTHAPSPPFGRSLHAAMASGLRTHCLRAAIPSYARKRSRPPRSTPSLGPASAGSCTPRSAGLVYLLSESGPEVKTHPLHAAAQKGLWFDSCYHSSNKFSEA